MRKSPRAPDSVEISPKMLEAGLEAFRRWNPIEDNASWIVADIFEEMTKAAIMENAGSMYVTKQKNTDIEAARDRPDSEEAAKAAYYRAFWEQSAKVREVCRSWGKEASKKLARQKASSGSR